MLLMNAQNGPNKLNLHVARENPQLKCCVGNLMDMYMIHCAYIYVL